MKWILLVYFFVVGPTGGWLEIQRVPYESRFDCQQAEENFNLNPDTLSVKISPSICSDSC